MKLIILCNDRLALPALYQLIQSKLVVAVGMTSAPSEVHLIVEGLCQNAHVPYFKLTRASLALDLRLMITQYRPDAVWVKTFPWKIPDEVLGLPKWGFFNFHYAPLPEFRGPNPLFWMIRDGAREIGVTVHRMTEEYDAGPILVQTRTQADRNSTFGMLISRLGYMGLELSGTLLSGMSAGNLQESPQDIKKGKWYGRPEQKDLWIDWKSMDATSVERLVNACNPWNKGAVAKFDNGWMIGITHAHAVKNTEKNHEKSGTIVGIDEQRGLLVACAKNTLLCISIVYTEEGFFPGKAMGALGLKSGMIFV